MDIFKGFRVRKTTSARALQAVKDGMPLTHPALSRIQWTPEDIKKLQEMGVEGAPGNVVDITKHLKKGNNAET